MRPAISFCNFAESILRSFSNGCEKATWSPDWIVGSNALSGLLLADRDASQETLHVPEPHRSRWLTPVDENQSVVLMLVEPGSRLMGAAALLDRPNSVENVG